MTRRGFSFFRLNISTKIRRSDILFLSIKKRADTSAHARPATFPLLAWLNLGFTRHVAENLIIAERDFSVLCCAFFAHASSLYDNRRQTPPTSGNRTSRTPPTSCTTPRPAPQRTAAQLLTITAPRSIRLARERPAIEPTNSA